MNSNDKADAAWDDYVSQQQEEKIEELERELNAANERIKQQDEWNERLDQRIDRLTEQIIFLSEIRQEAGVQDANLREKLSAANERIKRLEEAGDYLCAAAAFMGWHEKIEAWNKAKEAKP